VEWIADGRKHKLVLKSRDADGGIREPAVLQWVGEISPNNFWLYACGGWNGERGSEGKWAKPSPFETAKARGLVRCPANDLFAADWETCIDNINRLIELGKKPNSRTALNVVQDDEIKIRHSIFEV
jgi:hypothetical protein